MVNFWTNWIVTMLHIEVLLYVNIIWSFTLYPAHSRVDRGYLVLRHYVPHFLPNSGGIACWVADLKPRFALTPERRNGNINLSKYRWTRRWTPRLGIESITSRLYSHTSCRCATTALYYIIKRLLNNKDFKWYFNNCSKYNVGTASLNNQSRYIYCKIGLMPQAWLTRSRRGRNVPYTQKLFWRHFICVIVFTSKKVNFFSLLLLFALQDGYTKLEALRVKWRNSTPRFASRAER